MVQLVKNVTVYAHTPTTAPDRVARRQLGEARVVGPALDQVRALARRLPNYLPLVERVDVLTGPCEKVVPKWCRSVVSRKHMQMSIWRWRWRLHVVAAARAAVSTTAMNKQINNAIEIEHFGVI